MAVSDEKSWFERRIGLGKVLKFGYVVLCYGVESEVGCLFPLVNRVKLMLRRRVYFEVLLNLLDTDTQNIVRLDSRSVEKDDFYIFTFSNAV